MGLQEWMKETSRVKFLIRFLQTKPEGEGTGWAYQFHLILLRSNGGSIEVSICLVKATTITLILPITQTVEK